jgi:hypothetical protein
LVNTAPANVIEPLYVALFVFVPSLYKLKYPLIIAALMPADINVELLLIAVTKDASVVTEVIVVPFIVADKPVKLTLPAGVIPVAVGQLELQAAVPTSTHAPAAVFVSYFFNFFSC